MIQPYQPILSPQLTYTGPRLRGQATQFVQWQIYPLSSNQFWQTNSIVKIQGNTTVGLVDWYRSHLQFQVQVPLQYSKVGGCQVDISAYSAIRTFVLIQNGFQLQRIMAHDSLLAYLIDIGFSQLTSTNKQGMGIPYNNFPQSTILSTSRPQVNTVMVPNNDYTGTTWTSATDLYQTVNTSAYSPTLVSACPIGSVGTDTMHLQVNMWGQLPNHASVTNPLLFPQNAAFMKSKSQYIHRFSNLRAQYKYFCMVNQYPDSVQSLPLDAPKVSQQAWNYTNFTTTGYNTSYPYKIQFPSQGQAFGATVNPTILGCGINGYSKPISPDFVRGCFQPVISPTIPQCQMSYGKIQQYPTPISYRRFRIPMASSIVGINIPPDQFKLFPIQMFQNILLQLTLNPYFMFTTGYNDVHQVDTYGMTQQQQRKWRFTSFKWVWHLYSINDQDLYNYLETAMYKPIRFASKYWQLLIQFQLPNGQYVKQTNQIPVNVQSLTQIVVLFLSNQYLSFSGARKQFRLSNNINSMQLRANTVYYPLQPIMGQAGNPQVVDQNADNWNFLQQLYLSNNYLFAANVPSPRINKKNFAINSRIYDTTAKGTLYDLSIINSTAPSANIPLSNINKVNYTTMNPDTAMGQSWFHQNRYRGTAAYVYSFQPYGHSKTFVTGVNTIGWKQFQISFSNSPTNSFPSDQTQYVFGQCNVVIVLQKGKTIQVLGV